jgi:predicted amidophosphoribosyltransferase
MPQRIKCPQCQTWNEGVDYCHNCRHLLSHELQREQELEKLRQEEQQRPITRFYNYLNRLKASGSRIDKLKFRLLNSAWLIFLVLVTALIALVALAPG